MEYQRTFLRSALAKDPFALGDMGPEDVLRIEAEFPNLFSSSAQPSTDQTTTSSRPPVQKKLVCRPAQPTQVQGSTGVRVPLSHCPRWESHKQHTLLNANKMTTTVQATPKSPIPISKRIVNRPPIYPPKETFSTKLSPYLPIPEGLVSIAELKKALKEVLRENSSLTPQSLNCNSLKNPTILDYAHLRKLIQQDYGRNHNYLKNNWKNNQPEDCCLRSVCGSPKTPKHHHPGSVYKSPRPPQTLTNTPAGHSLCSTRMNKSPKKISVSESAPGFLRQGVPKRAAPLPLKKFPSSTKKVQFVPNQQPVEKDKARAVTDNRGKEKENCVEEKELDTKCEESTVSDDGRIYVQGVGEEVSSSTSESQDKFADPFLSYQQLKFTKNLATKYEKIGLLQKKIPDYGKTKQSPAEERKSQKCEKMDQRDDQTGSSIRENVIEFSPQKTKEQNPSLLETIAKELVYFEIMKHLHEIQQQEIAERQQQCNLGNTKEQEEDEGRALSQDNLDKLLQVTNKSLENLVAGRLSVIQEISEINLTTPTLSKSTNTDKSASLKNGSQCKPYSNIILTPETPDLSSSLRYKQVNFAAKDSPGVINANDATDCSEISDFVLSISEQDHFRTPQKVLAMKESPDNICSTPQMSISSSMANRQSREKKHRLKKANTTVSLRTTSLLSSPNFKTLSPKKSETVDHTCSNKKNVQKKGCAESNDTLENLSPSSKFEDVDDSAPDTPSEKSVSTNKNSQSQSLIMGLLSEGEFIGGVYKSPGEVSLCQTNPPPPVQQKIVVPSDTEYSSSKGSGSTIYFLTNNSTSTSSIQGVRILTTGTAISIGEFL